jgi:hypothetical protein
VGIDGVGAGVGGGRVGWLVFLGGRLADWTGGRGLENSYSRTPSIYIYIYGYVALDSEKTQKENFTSFPT